jgi:hypothetical protein
MTDRDHDHEPEERAPWDDDAVRGWQPSRMVRPRPPERPAEPEPESEPEAKPAETAD